MDRGNKYLLHCESLEICGLVAPAMLLQSFYFYSLKTDNMLPHYSATFEETCAKEAKSSCPTE